MKIVTAIVIAIGVFAALATGVYLAPGHGDDGRQGMNRAVEWQRMVNPGALSKSHAFLDHQCAACHTPGKGVEAVSCTVCHANDEHVLQRQPTAFHADIGRCDDCHTEHRGRGARTTRMDHDALARKGLQQLGNIAINDSEAEALVAWIRQAGGMSDVAEPSDFAHRSLTARERVLDCAVCHGNDDRHVGLFGNDCAACHESASWNLPEFRHPAANSNDCAQCHQAPPSHYMMHFKMISARVAGKPHAKVNECYACHQTTSWNDILGVGVYKHH